MKDNDIRKLSRAEILELLIEQTKENEALEAAVQERELAIAELRKQLDDRRIVLENAGSIAEASLRLNRVFEAAQAAADEYLENIRRQYNRSADAVDDAEAEIVHVQENMAQLPVQQESPQLVQRAQQEAQRIVQEAQKRCQMLESETAQKCEEMTQRAKRESQIYWDQVSAKLGALMKQRSQSSDSSAD